MSSFWTNFSAALSKAVAAAEAEITAAAHYFAPVVVASAEELGQIAVQAVLAEAPKVISGSEKLSNATSAVLTTLGAAGKQVGIADATAALQATYNAISAAAHPST